MRNNETLLKQLHIKDGYMLRTYVKKNNAYDNSRVGNLHITLTAISALTYSSILIISFALLCVVHKVMTQDFQPYSSPTSPLRLIPAHFVGLTDLFFPPTCQKLSGDY